MKFELSNIELVDIGPRIVKIGPEMQILEQFLNFVQNSLFSQEMGVLYVLKMGPLTTSGKTQCAVSTERFSKVYSISTLLQSMGV